MVADGRSRWGRDVHRRPPADSHNARCAIGPDHRHKDGSRPTHALMSASCDPRPPPAALHDGVCTPSARPSVATTACFLPGPT